MSESRRVRRLRRFRRRRRRLVALVVVLALVAIVPLTLGGLSAEVGPLKALHSRIFSGFQTASQASQSPDSSEGSVEEEKARSASSEGGNRSNESQSGGGGEPPAPEASVVQPSPAAAAYAAVAPALPGVEPSNVGSTFQSTDDPSWAVTGIKAPGKEDSYTVYSKKVDGGWEARRSVFANNPDYPHKGRAPLVDLPQDLQDALYSKFTAGPGDSPEETARELASGSPYLGEGWRPVRLRTESGFAKVRLQKKDSDGVTYAYLRRYEESWFAVGLGNSITAAELPDFPGALVDSGELPEAGPAMVPTAEPVLEDVPGERHEEVEKMLGETRDTVEGYEGTVGLYVQRSGEEWGYGIRPVERFYTASVIKVPVMAAVYRKVESGELSLSETVATKDRDYAGGAGGLQWQEESVSHTVKDYLWMMVTQSDNVATNVLVRAVGGAGYVNEVASDLGAEDTALRVKVTDQRAAAPALDNYTTPRDMAVMLEAVATGEVANEEHTEAMLGLMRQNSPDSWLGRPLPSEAEPACKAGWIGGVYNEACFVSSGSEPYVISVFSKYGPPRVEEGASTLEEISGKIWEIHGNDKEKSDKEED